MFHPRELLQWSSILRNRPLRNAVDEDAFWSLYAEAGAPLTGRPASLRADAPPALLIVVTTYQRPDACRQLLDRLREAVDRLTPTPSLRIVVINDRGTHDYAATRETGRRLFGADLVWLDARERLGKPGFWRIYQTAFAAARALAPRHTLFVQDDLEFAPDMLSEALRRFSRVEVPGEPCVLFLLSCEDDERFGRWIVYPRRELGGGLRRTQWFDLNAFLVNRAFFERLAYAMIPIHPNRWRRFPRISSGVGQQLTIRLFGRAAIYQASPTLVYHGAHASEMNLEARRRRELDNRPPAPRRSD